MTDSAIQAARRRAARIAGAVFLFINATGIFAEVFVRGFRRSRTGSGIDGYGLMKRRESRVRRAGRA